ncbi:hypothetical protein AB1K70_26795 [Bremerella sp. JC770]|uniref:hypothetical protein n=1 Tax=Bremerella sp. JC770 TaxID=3232137 RepID=UPI00345759F4
MMHATGFVQSRMAVRNLQHAARFARLCQQIERETVNADFADSRYHEIEAYAVAGIQLSVASIEANLNEILEDTPKFGCRLSDGAFRKVWEVWEKKPTLDKYQLVLLLLEKSEMPRGESIYQNTKALIDLRNVFVHFRPINDNEANQPTDELLHKFTPNRFFTRKENLVPQGCMSHSCLVWAVNTSLGFTREFLSRSQLRSIFNSRDDSHFATSEDVE